MIAGSTTAQATAGIFSISVFLGVTAFSSVELARAHTDADDEFAADVPLYQEIAVQAGIDHRYEGPWEYFVGGGISSFDCNQDRLPDLFIAGGSKPATLFINKSKPTGTLKFQALEGTSVALKNVTGSYPIDIDNDNYLDLVVLRVGNNHVFKGGPNCSFKPANASWTFDGGSAWTTAFSASFEPGKKYPTLAFGNYVDRTAPGSPWGTCHDNELHRAEGDEQPNYGNRQLLTPGYCALSVLFTDWNKSGADALRITNDRHYHRGGQEQLWQIDKGRYPRQYTAAEGWQPLVIWGMGIAEADLNADGFPEYALTSMGDTKLQSLDLQQAIDENRPTYEDIAWTRGATAHRPYTGTDHKPSTGWHAQFEDVNNDSLLDLFISKGNVESMAEFAGFDPDNLLMGRQDGRFVERGEQSGIALNRRGRGAAIVDLNADGLLDIVVVNRNDNVSVFHNTGMADDNRTRAGGNWLKLELRQPGINSRAIGAKLSVKTGNHVQSRRIQVGGGHASGSSGFVHFGLGVAERATVRIQWPDGQWSAPYKLFANHHFVINRGDDQALQWFAH